MISTSPRGGRPLVEASARLAMADLRGSFGFYSSHRMTAPDGTLIKLRLDVCERHGWVSVEHWPEGARWATASYDFALFAQDQHLGGLRWLFSCPLSGVRTPVLYLPPDADCLGSREAHGLSYRSQRLRAPARAAVRAQRIRLDLGGSADVDAPFPGRPKGMWSKTYERRRVVGV